MPRVPGGEGKPLALLAPKEIGTMTDINFEKWLNGISVVEEDHVFTPIGSQSERMTELLIERSKLLEDTESEGEDGPERSLAETYTERRNAIDKEIKEQLGLDHPDAPRIRIRGVSDQDVEEIQDEILDIQVEGKPLNGVKMQRESNFRLVSRASVVPAMSPQDVRLLRKRLNAGEWARLLDHVTKLMVAEAEAVDLPNS